GINDGAITAAEFGAVRIGLNLEFLQRLNRGLNDIVCFVQQVGEIGVIVHSVEQKIVLQRARAAGREAEATFVASPRLARRGAGSQQRKMGKITIVEPAR